MFFQPVSTLAKAEFVMCELLVNTGALPAVG